MSTKKIKISSKGNDNSIEMLKKLLVKIEGLEETNKLLADKVNDLEETNSGLMGKIDSLEDIVEGGNGKISTMSNKLDKVEDVLDYKLDDIEDKMVEIGRSLNVIKSGKIYINNFEFKELNENTHLDICKTIDHDIIINKLGLRDHRSILRILELFYKSEGGDDDMENKKINYPIKLKGKMGFEYFRNGKWLDDNYGDSVIDLLLMNFNKVFKCVNLYPQKVKKVEIFMENQKFIDELSLNDNCSRNAYNNFRKELKRHLKFELRKNEN